MKEKPAMQSDLREKVSEIIYTETQSNKSDALDAAHRILALLPLQPLGDSPDSGAREAGPKVWNRETMPTAPEGCYVLWAPDDKEWFTVLRLTDAQRIVRDAPTWAYGPLPVNPMVESPAPEKFPICPNCTTPDLTVRHIAPVTNCPNAPEKGSAA